MKNERVGSSDEEREVDVTRILAWRSVILASVGLIHVR